MILANVLPSVQIVRPAADLAGLAKQINAEHLGTDRHAEYELVAGWSPCPDFLWYHERHPFFHCPRLWLADIGSEDLPAPAEGGDA